VPDGLNAIEVTAAVKGMEEWGEKCFLPADIPVAEALLKETELKW